MNAILYVLLAFARLAGKFGTRTSVDLPVEASTSRANALIFCARLKPRNLLGKCKGCGKKHAAVDAVFGQVAIKAGGMDWREAAITADRVCVSPNGGGYYVAACGCGRRVVLRGVVGKYKPEHICNAKCMTSSGPSCECSCGGANHGRANG